MDKELIEFNNNLMRIRHKTKNPTVFLRTELTNEQLKIAKKVNITVLKGNFETELFFIPQWSERLKQFMHVDIHEVALKIAEINNQLITLTIHHLRLALRTSTQVPCNYAFSWTGDDLTLLIDRTKLFLLHSPECKIFRIIELWQKQHNKQRRRK